MKWLLATGLLSLSIMFAAHAGESAVVEEARAEAARWLALADSGEYGASWDSASTLFKTAVSREEWATSLRAARRPLGELESRDLASAEFSATLPGAPDGEYVVFRFSSSFENKATAFETVTVRKESDGAWKVAGYFLK